MNLLIDDNDGYAGGCALRDDSNYGYGYGYGWGGGFGCGLSSGENEMGTGYGATTGDGGATKYYNFPDNSFSFTQMLVLAACNWKCAPFTD